MAATYTLNLWERIRGRAQVEALISYSSESYSSGLTVTKASLDCPTSLDWLAIESATPGDSNLYKYDKSSEKIRIYAQGGSGADYQYEEVSGSQTVDIYVVARGW